MVRPLTLWPFPDEAFNRPQIKKFLDVELNMGQMVDDVKMACNDANKVEFHGRCGGVIPTPEEYIDFAKKVIGGAN